MFSQVLLKSLPQSVPGTVLIAGLPKVWANIPRLLVDPFVLESRSFAPFRFRHELARRPPMPRMNICWNYLYLSQKLEEIEDAATRQVFLDACGTRLGDFLAAHQLAGRL